MASVRRSWRARLTRRSSEPLTEGSTTLINLIQLQRVATTETDWKDGPIHVQPDFVVKVEAYDTPERQGYDTKLTLSHGPDEVVEGPPSEVIRRLRGGQ